MPRIFLLLWLAVLMAASTQGALAGAAQPEEQMVPRMDVEEAYRLHQQEEALFLDARTGGSWKASEAKIPGARRVVSAEQIEELAAQESKDRPIVIYCT